MPLPFLPLLAVSAASLASADSDWLALDSEIASLASTSSSQVSGVGLSGFIRSFYAHDDTYVAAPGGPPSALQAPKSAVLDLGGFEFESIRLAYHGAVEDMRYAVSMDLESGAAELLDAYVRWQVSDELTATFGQFKHPLLHSYRVSSARRLFVDSTLNAQNLVRQQGVQLGGALGGERGDWSITVANGTDAAGEDREYIGRVTYDVLGQGAFRNLEGGVGAREGAHASIGVAFADDKADVGGGRRTAFELAATAKGFAFHADLVDYDDGFLGTDFWSGHALADTAPNSLTLSKLVREDVEIGLRYEHFDDAENTKRRSVVVNLYSVLPHRVKWSFSYGDTDSDDASAAQQLYQAGLTLAF